MAQKYSTNMRRAAFRHLEAGEKLRATDRNDVAGYLFGIAAECAIKQMMIASGMRPLPERKRRDDPFFAHFAELKTMLRDTAAGRLGSELRRYAENDSFMQFWDVAMRYSDGKDVRAAWVERWYADAKNAAGAMDG